MVAAKPTKKKRRATAIRKLLGDEVGRWEIVTKEIRALRDALG